MTSCIFHFDASVFCRILKPLASFELLPVFYASAYQQLLDYTRMFWTSVLILYKCILQNAKIHSHLLGCRPPFMRVHTRIFLIALAYFGPPFLFYASVFCRILKSTRIFWVAARPLCECLLQNTIIHLHDFIFPIYSIAKKMEFLQKFAKKKKKSDFLMKR